MKTILITGATGLVGQKLIPVLQKKGYTISILSRTEQQIKGVETYVWDIKKNKLPQEAIDTADYIVHLAGANVGAERWTDERKKAIIDSRVKSGELLLERIRKSPNKPIAFITASAVGYYGLLTSEKIFTELDPPADDFFGKVGKAWEQVMDSTTALRIRSVALRLGVVLDKGDGALRKLSMPLKFGFGTPIGNGKQYMPWIHIDDAVMMFVHAIENNSMQGSYNATAPKHYTNADIMKALCKVKNRIYIPIGPPAFLLKLFLGEMAGIVLEGSRVSSKKILSADFEFQFPELKTALKNLK